MHSLADAWAAIAKQVQHLEPEVVALGLARERCLAESITARFPLPGFDNSAMDGYAVRHEEVVAAPSAAWTICGESRAGGPWPAPLPQGQVMRIFTGAPLPEGADTVVIQEHAELVAGAEKQDLKAVRFVSPPDGFGQHVRRRGSDLAPGVCILNPGQILHAGELALLASQGYSNVSVVRRPLVAILATGDELCDVDHAGKSGKVVNSNAYALAAQVEEAGGKPWVLEVAIDRKDAVVKQISAALLAKSAADVLVTVGGVSVGDYDVVWPALAEVGVTRHFWKVAVKPGKPIVFGSLGRQLVFGLPGNPVSAMVTFELFVRPALRKLQRDLHPYRAALDARLATSRRHGHSRTEVLPGRLSRDALGLRAEPVAHLGSGSLPSMMNIDALIFLPPGPDSYDAGNIVQVLPINVASSMRPPSL